MTMLPFPAPREPEFVACTAATPKGRCVLDRGHAGACSPDGPCNGAWQRDRTLANALRLPKKSV